MCLLVCRPCGKRIWLRLPRVAFASEGASPRGCKINIYIYINTYIYMYMEAGAGKLKHGASHLQPSSFSGLAFKLNFPGARSPRGAPMEPLRVSTFSVFRLQPSNSIFQEPYDPCMGKQSQLLVLVFAPHDLRLAAVPGSVGPRRGLLLRVS